MQTFGDRLRHERESRDTRIEDVAERTRIGRRYLEALENNDFDALPGPRGFGKLYIRAYAEMLGFDPRPLIQAFDEEHNRRLRADGKQPAPDPPRKKRLRYTPPPPKPVEVEPAPPPAVETEAVVKPVPAEPEPARPVVEAAPSVEGRAPAAPERAIEPTVGVGGRRPGRIIVAGVIGVGLLILAGVTLLPKSQQQAAVENAAGPATTTVQHGTEVAAGSPPEIAPREERQDASPATAPSTPVDREVSAEPPAANATAGPLRVTESGVGTAVVDRRLVGRGTRFEEGSVVAFFNRVVGATPGQTVQHVWLREGRVVQSTPLTLGGAHWRTYSNKTLWGPGNWAVETRDADDRVLARAEFTCEAR